MKNKLAILTSHPIHVQAPLFRKLENTDQIDLTVYFCWNQEKEKFYDEQFGLEYKWDVPVYEGYTYKHLFNLSPKPSSKFSGQINPGIVKEIIQNNYEAVIIFGWNSITNWLAAIACFITNTPLLIRSESPLHQEVKKEGWKQKIKKLIFEKFLFKYASAFLCIGEQNKKFYKFYGVPEERLFFTPYAVNNERFQQSRKDLSDKISKFRNELDIASEDVVVLFVGKLIHKKRPFDLLKAYQKIVQKNSPQEGEAHLLFVGDGNLRSDLEEYASENNLKNVHFVGFKNQTELPKYYAISDIFVLPSGMGETWGLVVNEAMNFKLPVIVSDMVGSGYDLVQEGKNGFTFPVEDINKLKENLEILIKDDKKRKKIWKRISQNNKGLQL
ncbi:MAG: glycosyltransferase family 4 protein [Candidatus Magasanikbacteria bacterium]